VTKIKMNFVGNINILYRRSTQEEKRSEYRVLVEKPGGKRQLGRPRRR
jgi:hypothetical protein